MYHHSHLHWRWVKTNEDEEIAVNARKVFSFERSEVCEPNTITTI